MLRMSMYAHPHVRKSGSYFGYAYTYYEIEKHLRQYSYNGQNLQLDLNSPKSKVQLYYGSPPGFFYPHQYKIQMTQWESTLVPPNWVDHAKDYNEWWTANQFGADAFIRAGVPHEKIHVYEHGVDSSMWTPKKRGQNDRVRFLHVDSGSPRKRADIAISAFRKAFGNNINYQLTLKHSHHAHSNLNWDDTEVLENAGEWEYNNVRHIRENLSLQDLVKLFHYHDVLIYPSEGEGFGLIPLQALATGMPVISTSRWCSYEKYFPNTIIDSRIGISDIIENYTRFGEVVIPNVDSAAELIKYVGRNIEDQSEYFFNQIPNVVEEYSWSKKTNMIMDSLVDRLGLDMFTSSRSHLS
jgi:glycosyltransferase involved in cell wall biosynthesis